MPCLDREISEEMLVSLTLTVGLLKSRPHENGVPPGMVEQKAERFLPGRKLCSYKETYNFSDNLTG